MELGNTLGGGLNWKSLEKKASMVESLKRIYMAPARCGWKSVKLDLLSGGTGQDLMPCSLIARGTSGAETKRK